MFPEEKEISLCRIGTTRDAEDCDVLCLSDEDLQALLAAGKPLTKPLLMKNEYSGQEHDLVDRLRQLVARGTPVSIGDPRLQRRYPDTRVVEEVISAIKGETRLCGDHPFTMLDILSLPRQSPIPKFLSPARFDVMKSIGSRVRTELSGSAGKPNIAIPTDLTSAISSTMFATRCAFTGMHRDVLPSWVLSLGTKAWILPAPGAKEVDFEAQGEEWAPDVRVLILEANDYLVMPSPTPHAVLTIDDSWMCAGMFIDLYNILAWMDSLIYAAEWGNTTNEPIPRELISGWHHLQEFFIEHVKSLALQDQRRQISGFKERETKLQGLLSCPL
ncbi:hypothetical protein NLG97_g865 [Lecanicillium saksenae]|uniref:Uncharacterized protein n=1 Tax=Lecanicillium saksenae TaxID=468837 RepID=A0ACC1R6S9_9HYPO|nr:hypothetical protein NLG97_g865 [Lecanicillium saksenae]